MTSIVGFGRGYYIGKSEKEYIKLDLMYTDPFLEEAEEIESIRMTGVKDIIAMKMNVVSRCGRKKNFGDLHRLLDEYSLAEMFDFMRDEIHGSTIRKSYWKNSLILPKRIFHRNRFVCLGKNGTRLN